MSGSNPQAVAFVRDSKRGPFDLKTNCSRGMRSSKSSKSSKTAAVAVFKLFTCVTGTEYHEHHTLPRYARRD
jgi:hypothetical protein